MEVAKTQLELEATSVRQVLAIRWKKSPEEYEGDGSSLMVAVVAVASMLSCL